jgi:hypothetical protein
MGADRTPFAGSGTPASFDDVPFARAVFGAFATCTGFASSIVLCALLEDGLRPVALLVELLARARGEQRLALPDFAAPVAAVLVRSGNATPLR